LVDYHQILPSLMIYYMLVERKLLWLKLNFILYFKKSSGSFQVLETKSSSDLLTMGTNFVYASLVNDMKIPHGSMSVYYYNITLKDNVMSNPVVYAIINNECHECQNSKNCTVKVSSI
jgi:hypothetical protein